MEKRDIKETSTLFTPFLLKCSLRKTEFDRLKKVFDEKNDDPNWVIKQVLNEVKKKYKTSVNNVTVELQVFPVTDAILLLKQ